MQDQCSASSSSSRAPPTLAVSSYVLLYLKIQFLFDGEDMWSDESASDSFPLLILSRRPSSYFDPSSGCLVCSIAEALCQTAVPLVYAAEDFLVRILTFLRQDVGIVNTEPAWIRHVHHEDRV